MSQISIPTYTATPVQYLVRRASDATCISCPSEAPTCPLCSSGESCVQIPRSCLECALLVCKSTASDPTLHMTNVGAIVGGVVGSLAVIALLAFIYWRFFYKVKRIEIEAEAEADKEFYDNIPPDAHEDASTVQPMPRRNGPTRVTGPNLGRRLSQQTTTSTINTQASNIIPIAYIPGVTIRQNAKPKLVYSTMDGESMFSDWNTLEDASIVERKGSTSSKKKLPTTTAIKAQPRVVDVREKPTHELPVRGASTNTNNAASRLQNELIMEDDEDNESLSHIQQHGDDPFVLHEGPEESDDDDSDDSDREAIEAATSAHHSRPQSKPSHAPSAPPFAAAGPPLRMLSLSRADEVSIADSGSFVMEFGVDIDEPRSLDPKTERLSPFHDDSRE
ncbi:hypothetical protein BABINDRAFT_153631 [Babjeviella inositovora NRRL Y-12698]|uniref:Membrane anchor Opy2 N-terminal domain-containing protein n=1 Tax=Babjeviella inositovora NRRL Y-12698 TaxID=984486 RepID=A0A1E3QMH2_9ASCO|nr:uncharacterized protein BABINDRAFT_153631 [Babjeviella inositovora NRRL Y-12698]ODQ78830.1 hypothetical protein BABINDRAFT_153631 [Babjeviella inositovora NRRL Y-12698]